MLQNSNGLFLLGSLKKQEPSKKTVIIRANQNKINVKNNLKQIKSNFVSGKFNLLYTWMLAFLILWYTQNE